ncbi:MAG: hypothetical protein LC745_04130, partial [Planctomycetia bacterium]|nr:hypothetical protein [Planctomycetia bacterium]
NVAVLHQKNEGLVAHLEGLDSEARATSADLRKLFERIGHLGRRQDELDAKLETVHALHWDHVALAHRLSVIEDLLAAPRPVKNDAPRPPSIPFPGLDDGPISQVG